LRVAELEQLLGSIRVPASVEGRLEEDVQHSLDHLPAREALRKRDDVRVVVAARQLRRVRLGNRGASDARNLVRGHGDAEARAADDDTAVGLTRRDGLPNRVTVLRIVDGRRVVRSVIDYVMSAIAQNLRDAILVFETGVICAEGDFHSFFGYPVGEGESERAVEGATPMKLACASGSFHRTIESGELTQLEFLDLCARELACDAVVLDVRHFPRIDDDYLAQIKKMAADRGLTLAALADPAFFGSTREHMNDVLRRAAILGAPLVSSPLARDVDCSWSEQLVLINVATSLAKSLNVTLAVRNAAATFAASTHDCKRVAKEADSAWLRFGPEPQELDPASDPLTLQGNSVLLWSDVGAQSADSIAATIKSFAGFRGHLALDERDGGADAAKMSAALRGWRQALARAASE
jgi:hypothetical protein